ncbi:MAG TPA: 3,4-dihydroxy-2-butanone-4-phosphate synthase [Candidatus Sulfotelmatobacter sp.]|nr:3,4-dihydroxy-2-butanone-4-phosphate synthase [Candidatus Sulfotelmatobacter sp.]
MTMDVTIRASLQDMLSPIEDIIEDARRGKCIVLVDDEDRENEGDLIIPAECATPEVINFMAKYGRGLICLPLARERVEELGLPLMAQNNGSRHKTAFTVSIEAREGIATGISAADRARTIAVAIDPTKGRTDIVSPGHVFPLVARDGGVLVRAGHTEAAVDTARLAGFQPAGVVCEIMNDDGTMARLPDLVRFAQFHGLKLGTIADLIAYRRRREKLVERTVETTFESAHGGGFRLIVYASKIGPAEHIALVKGDLSGGGAVLVRMHAVNVLDDILGDRSHGPGGELESAMRLIGEAGRGVVVLIREGRPKSVSERIKARLANQPESRNELRDYGVGAQILLDLGVREMILLSNTKRTIIGLDGYGLTLVGQQSLPLRDLW